MSSELKCNLIKLSQNISLFQSKTEAIIQELESLKQAFVLQEDKKYNRLQLAYKNTIGQFTKDLKLIKALYNHSEALQQPSKITIHKHSNNVCEIYCYSPEVEKYKTFEIKRGQEQFIGFLKHYLKYCKANSEIFSNIEGLESEIESYKIDLNQFKSKTFSNLN